MAQLRGARVRFSAKVRLEAVTGNGAGPFVSAQGTGERASRSRGADACASTTRASKSAGWAKVQYNQARLGALRSKDAMQREVKGQSERRPASLRIFARSKNTTRIIKGE
jgi:hypothetical protein